MRYTQRSSRQITPRDRSVLADLPRSANTPGIATARSATSRRTGAREWLGSLFGVAVAIAALAVVAAPPALGVAASAAWNAGPHTLAAPEVVLQSQAVTCGPAVLATLTSWFGSPRSEAELIAAASLGPDGVTLGEFARLAHSVGLAGTWYSVPPISLASVPSPFVAHMNMGRSDSGLGHLVAVAAVAFDYVVVADPAVGTYVLSLHGFSRSYSGRLFALDGAS